MATLPISKQEFAFDKKLHMSEMQAYFAEESRRKQDARGLLTDILEFQKRADQSQKPVEEPSPLGPRMRDNPAEWHPEQITTALTRMMTDGLDPLMETLALLRRLGYCNERSYRAMTDRAIELAGPGIAWTLEMESLTLSPTKGPEQLRDAFKKNEPMIWLEAVAQVLFRYHLREVMESSAKAFSSFVKPHIPDVYLAAVNTTARYAWEAKDQKNEKTLVTARNKLDEKKAELKDLRRSVDESIKAAENRGALRYKDANTALREENSQLKRRIESLEKKLAQQAQSLKAKADSAPVENPEISEATEIAELDEVKQEIEIPDFPKDGVIFIGGHENLQKKYRLRHPNWSFFASEEKSKFAGVMKNPSTKKVNVVIIWSKHLSHPVYNKMMECVSADTPILYAASTNLDTLDREILTQWRDLCEKRQAQVS